MHGSMHSLPDIYKDEATHESRKNKEEEKTERPSIECMGVGGAYRFGNYYHSDYVVWLKHDDRRVYCCVGSTGTATGNYAAVAWDTRVADYWIHQGSFVIGIRYSIFVGRMKMTCGVRSDLFRFYRIRGSEE